jgi:hypothetical protein
VLKEEAQQILALFRPGTADEKDPFFREARQMSQADPELARWFDAHCEACLILRRKFQAIPIPPGLKEQILSERKIHRPFFQKHWRPLLAAAAAVALLIGLESGGWPVRNVADDYAAFQKRMTKTALRSYSMDLMESDPVLIRKFLQQKHAPSDYSLPAGLKTAALVGCVVTSWQGHPVSMICFKSGRLLPPGDESDLWLFVTDRQAVAQAPPPGAPVLTRFNKASAASWSDDTETYLLTAVGDEAFLRKYL